MFQDLVATLATPLAVLPSWKQSMLHEVEESKYTAQD